MPHSRSFEEKGAASAGLTANRVGFCGRQNQVGGLFTVDSLDYCCTPNTERHTVRVQAESGVFSSVDVSLRQVGGWAPWTGLFINYCQSRTGWYNTGTSYGQTHSDHGDGKPPSHTPVIRHPSRTPANTYHALGRDKYRIDNLD